MKCKREKRLESLMKEKMFQINLIKTKLEQAKERIESIEKEIDKNGASARFSINEDMLAIIQDIWKHSHGLYWLDKTKEYLKED